LNLISKGKHPHQVRQMQSRRACLKHLCMVTQAITFGIPLVHAEKNGDTRSSAESAAASFYTWYLREMSQNHAPLEDSTSVMKQKVALSTLNSIRKKRNSPDGMEMDYFIQTQDYADEWIEPPHVKTSTTSGTTTDLRVTLGAGTAESYELTVLMTLEDKTWKILKVTTPRKKKS
jgi:hypothetical protein